MKITRTSPITGRTLTRDIDCTPEQLAAWEGGTRAQVAFPTLSADDREFIMTGISPIEWEAVFQPKDDQ
jgi:hypothetical protein